MHWIRLEDALGYGQMKFVRGAQGSDTHLRKQEERTFSRAKDFG